MARHVSTSEVGEELASLLEAVKDGKVEVTHGIEAGISEEAVGFFSTEIWPHAREPASCARGYPRDRRELIRAS